jgi:hypothetical protein
MNRSTLEPRLASDLRRPPALHRGDPAFQAYALLHLGFTSLAFATALLYWSRGRVWVGLAQAAVGCVLAVRPSWGGALYGAWFAAMAAMQLAPGSGLADWALSSAGLALGAFALSRLATQAGR